MRARNNHPLYAGPGWLMALILVPALILSAASQAQEEPATEPTSESTAEPSTAAQLPTPPQPPSAPEVPSPPEPQPDSQQVDKQVRITRGEDGSLHIRTLDEKGERTEVQVDLGDVFGGAVSQRIITQLESQGLVDEKGRVTGEALDSMPKNISIGITGDFDDMGDHHGQAGNFGFDAEDVLVPIVAILAVFGTPILIVWLATRNSYRKKQLLMESVNRLVTEGRDIPPELLDAMEGESPRNMKDRGFTLIAVGLALFIWLSISSGVEVGSLGLIPLFIGVARFINWKLDNQNGPTG